MALSKRLKKFLGDTAKSQAASRKRRQKVLNRIGPMSESESKAYTSPSRNVPRQGKKSFDNVPTTTQLDMLRRSVQRYDRRDFDNKRFAQDLAGQKSVVSPRPRVRKSNSIQMGTGPNAQKREPAKKKGAMQRFLEGKGAIGKKRKRRGGPFGL